MLYQIELDSNLLQHSYSLCPKCNESFVVQHDTIYTCLKCGFRRNVKEEHKDEPKSEGIFPGWVVALGGVFLLLALL